jgi:hypothetical protein
MTRDGAALALIAVADLDGADASEAGRGLLRRLAAEALGCDPSVVGVASDPAGRPRIAHPPAGSALRCSVAHAGSLVVAVVGIGCAAGVDVEPVDPRRTDVATVLRYVDAATAAELAALDEDQRPRAAALAWTRLEAEAKGRGASIDRLRGRPGRGVAATLELGGGHVGTVWTDRPATVRHGRGRSPVAR